MPSSAVNQQLRVPFGLILLFACVPLYGFWTTGLFDLDEGFYGAVVSEMNRRGEWVTPYYNGSPWFEKPILLYWLAKPFVSMFGIWVGSRFPSVLCTIGLYCVTFVLGRRIFGDRSASYAVMCLGSSLLILALGRLMMTDAPLNLALTTAFLSFYLSLTEHHRWRILTAAMLGVGVLAKGPVCLLLFAPIAAITYWKIPEFRIAFRGSWTTGILVFVLVVSSWYVPCYLQNRSDFVQKFLIEQNLQRFTGGDVAHSAGWWTLPMYLPILWIGTFPWSTLEIGAFRKFNLDTPAARFCLIWGLAILVFFSISSAKLPHYILPVVPPMALLVGKKMAEQPRWQWSSPLLNMCFGILFLILLDSAQRAWYVQSGQAEAHRLAFAHPDIAATYQLSKQEGIEKQTKLQETSLPSLVMVLNRPLLQTDSKAEIERRSPIKVFTRAGRISSLPEEERAGWKLVGDGKYFHIYEVQRP